MDRNAWMIGVGTSTNFSQFEAGNNGANYYHYNQRLWEGKKILTDIWLQQSVLTNLIL
jgi:hypothetical protein